MKEAFITKRFTETSLGLIHIANKALVNYARQGYRLTLRQLYYHFIAKDYLPESWKDSQTGTKNNIRNYKRFGSLVSDARLAGMLDWDVIEDRGRESVIPSHWKDPADIIEAAVQSFRVDHWQGQPNYVEVMVEKDALSGILEPVCRKLDVRFSANKGYSSSSAMYEAGKRFARASREGRDLYLLYLGDHDPSGIDMTRDILERLELFSGRRLDIQRLALNMDQVEQWNPPENPAKESDSRFASYAEQFGESSWELDAVEPATLAELVEDAVGSLVDEDIMDNTLAEEAEMLQELRGYADDYRASHPE